MVISDIDQQQFISIFRDAIVAGVRSNGPDLSVRQLSVLLITAPESGPHTVRGMAAALNVSKPAITRALDRLGELDLVRRKIDPMDRRSVLALVTPKGREAVVRIGRNMIEAAKTHANASQ